ncbi:hypothetical protein HanPI659440_Chr05g0210991 [Helianthus annuus]|nr:hypothetical protein HanPI659440_Chr05g0210991 [Helianthus annuus]
MIRGDEGAHLNSYSTKLHSIVVNHTGLGLENGSTGYTKMASPPRVVPRYTPPPPIFF